MSIDSMHKRLKNVHKNLPEPKKVNLKRNENKDLKSKVLSIIGDIFNDLYDVYKEGE